MLVMGALAAFGACVGFRDACRFTGRHLWPIH